MVDMELDDEDKIDMAVPQIAQQPDYPWGLRLCLTEKELKKLGLEADCSIGDVIDLRCFAVVTSVSSNQTDSGLCCRVELQVQKMAVENEADDD